MAPQTLMLKEGRKISVDNAYIEPWCAELISDRIGGSLERISTDSKGLKGL